MKILPVELVFLLAHTWMESSLICLELFTWELKHSKWVLDCGVIYTASKCLSGCCKITDIMRILWAEPSPQIFNVSWEISSGLYDVPWKSLSRIDPLKWNLLALPVFMDDLALYLLIFGFICSHWAVEFDCFNSSDFWPVTPDRLLLLHMQIGNLCCKNCPFTRLAVPFWYSSN